MTEEGKESLIVQINVEKERSLLSDSSAPNTEIISEESALLLGREKIGAHKGRRMNLRNLNISMRLFHSSQDILSFHSLSSSHPLPLDTFFSPFPPTWFQSFYTFNAKFFAVSLLSKSSFLCHSPCPCEAMEIVCTINDKGREGQRWLWEETKA